MKTTQMVKMDIPARLVPEEKVEFEKFDMSRYAGGSFNDHLRWNSLNYLGVLFMSASIALNMLTGFEALFLTLSIISGSLTGISLLINGIVLLCGGSQNISPLTKEIKGLNKPIALDELEKRTYLSNGNILYLTENGFRIKQRAGRVYTARFFMPARFFRKQILSETTWYNPKTDIYLKKQIFLKANTLGRSTETYYGSRHAFKQALDKL